MLFNPAVSFDPTTIAPDEKRGRNFGGRMGVDPAKLSPADHVTSQTPPTLILVGTEDYLLGGVRRDLDLLRRPAARLLHSASE